jgi:hypothetical protein
MKMVHTNINDDSSRVRAARTAPPPSDIMIALKEIQIESAEMQIDIRGIIKELAAIRGVLDDILYGIDETEH